METARVYTCTNEAIRLVKRTLGAILRWFQVESWNQTPLKAAIGALETIWKVHFVWNGLVSATVLEKSSENVPNTHSAVPVKGQPKLIDFREMNKQSTLKKFDVELDVEKSRQGGSKSAIRTTLKRFWRVHYFLNISTIPKIPLKTLKSH